MGAALMPITMDLSYETMLRGLHEIKRHLAGVVAQQISLERQMKSAHSTITPQVDKLTGYQRQLEDRIEAFRLH